jgi:hypothetical protein
MVFLIPSAKLWAIIIVVVSSTLIHDCPAMYHLMVNSLIS